MSINRFLSEELILVPPKLISHVGSSGDLIYGYLQKPSEFDETRTYPMIKLAHGGPYTCRTSWFAADIQAIAAAGYFTFYINPRGSES